MHFTKCVTFKFSVCVEFMSSYVSGKAELGFVYSTLTEPSLLPVNECMLCFHLFTDALQTKKVRKVPPGLPSSVSGRSSTSHINRFHSELT